MRDWILQENDRVSTEMVVKLRYGNNLIFLLKVVLSGREGLWTGNWRPKHVSITSEQFYKLCSNSFWVVFVLVLNFLILTFNKYISTKLHNFHVDYLQDSCWTGYEANTR